MHFGVRAMVLMSAAVFAAGAVAPSSGQPHCQVVGANKLPAASGGATALCAAVNRELARQAPGLAYHATIRVISPSRLSATVHVDSRTLPEQRFSSMDRPLAKSSFDRFAKAIAAQVAASRAR